MTYVWEFEFFKSDDCVCAVPCPPMEGGTFGENFDDAMDSAVDWLGEMVEAHLTDGLELPAQSFGHKPENGGRIVAVASTPMGGDYSEIVYFDDEGGVVDPSTATRCVVRECKEDGTLIAETWGVCGGDSL